MNIKHNVTEPTVDARFSGECDNSNDNMTMSSANEYNETNSSRSNSVSSDAAGEISSNDEAADDDHDEDDDFDARIDVDWNQYL